MVGFDEPSILVVSVTQLADLNLPVREAGPRADPIGEKGDGWLLRRGRTSVCSGLDFPLAAFLERA